MAKVSLTRPTRSVTTYVKQSPTKPSRVIPPPPSLSLKGEGGEGKGLFPDITQTGEEGGVDSILDAVGKLSPEDQKQILARLALSTQTDLSKTDRDLEMWVAAVYDRLVAAIGAGGRGLPGPAPLKRLLASGSNWSAIKDFMKASNLQQLTVTQRQSVYGMLAKLVVDRARSISRATSIPISTKLVANCSTNVAGIFDAAFPGYMESGLAGIVAQRLISSNSESDYGDFA